MAILAPQVPCPNCGGMLTVGNVCANCYPYHLLHLHTKNVPDPYIRISSLEATNVRLTAQVERYKGALDEAICATGELHAGLLNRRDDLDKEEK